MAKGQFLSVTRSYSYSMLLSNACFGPILAQLCSTHNETLAIKMLPRERGLQEVLLVSEVMKLPRDHNHLLQLQ